MIDNIASTGPLPTCECGNGKWLLTKKPEHVDDGINLECTGCKKKIVVQMKAEPGQEVMFNILSRKPIEGDPIAITLSLENFPSLFKRALSDVENEYAMGGLSEGLYAEYAWDVYLRYETLKSHMTD